MADIYADGQLGTGANNGSSWVNAYQGEAGLQSACDAAIADDIIHITRTFTLTAAIDIDTASGNNGSPIRVIGYNYNSGSPIVDGTRSILDANSAAANCIAANGVHYWVLENIEFKNATGDNVTAVTADVQSWTFINCISHDAGGDGWGYDDINLKYISYARYIACQSYSNGSNGFYCYRSFLIGCTAYSNGAVGFAGQKSELSNCVSYKNGTDGIYIGLDHVNVNNCVVDGNVSRGIYFKQLLSICCCRITNNPSGLEGDGSSSVLGLWNFLSDNTITESGINTLVSLIKGEETMIVSGEIGYLNISNSDYRLNSSATSRRIEVEL